MSLLLAIFGLLYGPSLADLSSPRYAVRELATRRLAHDPLSLPATLHGLRAGDAECRARCKAVLRVHLHRSSRWAAGDDGLATVYLAFTGRNVGECINLPAAQACGLIEAYELYAYYDPTIVEYRAIGEPHWWDVKFDHFHGRRPLFAWLWDATH